MTFAGARPFDVAVFTLSLLALSVVTASGVAEEERGKAEGRSELSIDEGYVRARLEEYLQPSSIQFLDDGKVRLRFGFKAKNPDHAKVFTPIISKSTQSGFRWTTKGEEYYSSFYSRRKTYRGLRLGNSGVALLNCWFKDDVEAEVEYAHGRNFLAKQVVALAYYTDKHRALGGNFGTQATLFKKRTPKKRSGALEPVVMDEEHRFKLKMNEGIFEVFRDGNKKESLEYEREDFESGRIGFIWNGGVAGFITYLEIEGRLDSKRMAKEIRRRLRK